MFLRKQNIVFTSKILKPVPVDGKESRERKKPDIYGSNGRYQVFFCISRIVDLKRALHVFFVIHML